MNTNAVSNRLDLCVAEYRKRSSFSGSLLIVQEGREVYNNSFGFANVEHEVPASSATKYRIWSITKLFTATAILILQEKQALTLDDFIDSFFPNIPRGWDKRITIRHLLTHTSGIKSYTHNEQFDTRWNKHRLDHEDVLRLFWDEPLEFEPGTDCSYNNSAYYLLGLIIEKAAGMSYEQYLRRSILEPLGMRNTGLENNREIVPGMAQGYRIEADEVRKSEYVDIETAYSAGGMYSTTSDLFLLDQALLTEKLVSARTLEQATSPFYGTFGLGWQIHPDRFGRRIGHSGAYRGYQCEYARYPEKRTSIIILSNLECPVDSLRDELADKLFG